MKIVATIRNNEAWANAVMRARVLTSAIVGFLEAIVKMRIETEMDFFEKRMTDLYYEEEVANLKEEA